MKKLRPITPHSILTEKLEQIVKDPSLKLTTASVQEKISYCYLLASGLDRYLEENTTEESDQLASISRLTRENDWGSNRHETDVSLKKFCGGHGGASLVLRRRHDLRTRGGAGGGAAEGRRAR